MAKPNFVIAVCDDAAYDMIDYMPETKGMLKNGLTFTNSFCDNPLCAPSRATCFTGLTSHNHSVTGNERHSDEEWAKIFEKTTVKDLRDSGYRTVLIGVKVINGFDGTPDILGFTDWHVLTDHGGDKRYIDPEIDHNGTVEQHLGYSTDIFGDLMRQEIVRAEADAVPLYMYVAFATPHAPAIPSLEFEGVSDSIMMPRSANFGEADRDDKPFFIRDTPAYDDKKKNKVEDNWRDRVDCMQSVDREWKSVLDQVSTMYGDWHCILTSDNGFMHGAHCQTGKLLAAYDESVRVFLVWWQCVDSVWGCIVPRGGKRKQIVCNTDVPATFLDLADVPSSQPLDGKSLRELFVGDTNTPWRTALGVTGAWGGSEDGEEVDPEKRSYCVYEKNWRYCYHVGPGIDGELDELYDLRKEKSPDGAEAAQQLTNVAGRPEYDKKLHQLKEKAKALAVCIGEECFIKE